MRARAAATRERLRSPTARSDPAGINALTTSNGNGKVPETVARVENDRAFTRFRIGLRRPIPAQRRVAGHRRLQPDAAAHQVAPIEIFHVDIRPVFEAFRGGATAHFLAFHR